MEVAFPGFSELRDVLLVCAHITVNFPGVTEAVALLLTACSCAAVCALLCRPRGSVRDSRVPESAPSPPRRTVDLPSGLRVSVRGEATPEHPARRRRSPAWEPTARARGRAAFGLDGAD